MQAHCTSLNDKMQNIEKEAELPGMDFNLCIGLHYQAQVFERRMQQKVMRVVRGSSCLLHMVGLKFLIRLLRRPY
jgi:hypothetical protein